MIYGREFFESHSAGALQSARAVIPILIDLVHPQKVIDFGCGIGTWLSVFVELGVQQIIGYDGKYVAPAQLVIPRECFRAVDLERMAFDKLPIADLAISFEVAEHLSPQAGERLIKSLVSSADIVAFSAAIPWQGGAHHVNEQWPDYWSERFARHGYEQFDVVRPLVWDNEKVEPWYRQNIFVYARRDCPLYVKLTSIPKPILSRFNVVHPEQFSRRSAAARLSTYPGKVLLQAALARLVRRIGIGRNHGIGDGE